MMVCGQQKEHLTAQEIHEYITVLSNISIKI